MSQIVSARTIAAGTLFYSTIFSIPDYQRCYKWGKDEVETFFDDLARAKERDDEYFLGLIITTAGNDGEEELVDGQQRLLTLTLLVNCLRLEALACGRNATADNIRQTYLFSFEEEDERLVPRMRPSDEADAKSLESLLSLKQKDEAAIAKNGVKVAHNALSAKLQENIDASANPSTNIASWAKWIKEKLSFVWFQHPSASAAYNVFMVVNTRGLDLTGSELIKAHLLSVATGARDDLSNRWSEVEAALRDNGAGSDDMTAYVRHVYLLDHSYVISKYLFNAIADEYSAPDSVVALLDRLEAKLPDYLVLLNPLEAECDDESFKSVAAIMKTLNIRTARPLLLAMRHANAQRRDYELLAATIASRWAAAMISSNVDEVTMATTARAIFESPGSLAEQLGKLRESLMPEREEVLSTLKSRPFKTRNQAKILLSSREAESSLPPVSAFTKVPRRVFGWLPAYSDVRLPYDRDALIGNWAFDDDEITRIEPVPTVDGAISIVNQRSAEIAQELVGVWYEG